MRSSLYSPLVTPSDNNKSRKKTKNATPSEQLQNLEKKTKNTTPSEQLQNLETKK
jgi:hypothetical protein